MNIEPSDDTTINRSFLIFKNSEKINEYLDQNSNIDRKTFETEILPYFLIEKKESIENLENDKLNKILHLQKHIYRYPLENSWSFWFYKNSRKTNNWSENLIHLINIDSVEEFWSVHSHLKPVEFLSNGCDYSFFKNGIKPMWEDSYNLNGERWIVSLPKRSSSNFLNSLWLNALLSLIGSHYDDDAKFINGVVISIRFRYNKLALWLNCQGNEITKSKIMKRFKKEINLTDTDFFFEIQKIS